jgi:Co/Zn/Cd efflux system component
MIPNERMELIDPEYCDEFMGYLCENTRNTDHPHGYDHDDSHGPKVSSRLITIIILNGLILVAELLTGYITQSLSLQSDAWHVLFDQVSLIVGLMAHQMSKRPSTS